MRCGTPYTTSSNFSVVFNGDAGDVVGGGAANRTLAFSGFPEFVLADWTPAATAAAVPEPATFTLLAFGLAGVGVVTGDSIRRTRAAQAAVPVWTGDPFEHCPAGSEQVGAALHLPILLIHGPLST